MTAFCLPVAVFQLLFRGKPIEKDRFPFLLISDDFICCPPTAPFSLLLLLVVLLPGLQHYALSTFKCLEPKIHLIYPYFSQTHMLAATVILPCIPSSLCSAFLVALRLLPSSCPRRSEWLPSDLHLLGDNMQTPASDFASLILSSVFPLPLHLSTFKTHQKYSTATEALDFFFFSAGPCAKRGQLCGERCRAKIKPISHCTPSENTELCHEFLLVFFFFSPLTVKPICCRGVPQ